MIILPSTFEYHKYGVDARFVTECDASFILELRNNPRLARYIHSTDDDIVKQKEWIKSYKYREEKGLEYYFIYLVDGIPFGVNRLNNINLTDNSCSSGSWLCKQGTDINYAMSTFLIQGEILFEKLKLDKNYFEVDKANKQVLRFEKIRGARFIGEDERSYKFCMDYDSHMKSCNRIKNLLNIK